MTGVKRRSDGVRQIARAIIYARVSKDDAGGRSVREQIASCEKECEFQGWTVGLVLKDNDRGASRHSRREREDFEKLPKVLQSGDVLVVWEPSRITRNMKEFSPFCDMLAERGVMLYYDDHLHDMNDDDDRNRVWQDILDGAKQAAKTRKRTRRAMAANLDDLKRHGRVPPGYRVVRDQSGKSVGWEPVPELKRILREGAKHAIDEDEPWSWQRISRELEPRWREAGGAGRFDPEDVKRILSNATLFGYRVSGKQIAGQGKHPAILDPEWYPTLKALADSKKHPASRGGELKWLLSYIARCGVCLEMEGERGVIHRKKSPQTVCGESYVCRKYNHVQRDMARVDAHVEELLMQLLEAPEALKKLRAKDKQGRVSIEMEMEAIEEMRRDIDEYVAEASKTRMSAASVSKYVVPLEEDIEAAQARIDALTRTMNPALVGVFGPDARERWFGTETKPGYALERRREIIRAAMDIRLVRTPKLGRYSDVGVEVWQLV